LTVVRGWDANLGLLVQTSHSYLKTQLYVQQIKFVLRFKKSLFAFSEDFTAQEVGTHGGREECYKGPINKNRSLKVEDRGS